MPHRILKSGFFSFYLTRLPRVREVESSFPKGRPNLTQRS